MGNVWMIEWHMPKGVYQKSASHGAALSAALMGNLNSQKHGSCSRIYRSPEYVAWQNMRSRCNNPSHPQYSYYGGRGISISSDWDDFSVFLEHIGNRPSDAYSIDRIDNMRGYEPGNVRWATKKQQALNRRSVKIDPKKLALILSSPLSSVKLSSTIGMDASHIRKIRRESRIVK